MRVAQSIGDVVPIVVWIRILGLVFLLMRFGLVWSVWSELPLVGGGGMYPRVQPGSV